MIFKDKYVINTEAALPANIKKIIISNDAYAVGEMIENLINKIEHARSSLAK